MSLDDSVEDKNYERKPLKGGSKMKTFEDLVCDIVEEKFKDLTNKQLSSINNKIREDRQLRKDVKFFIDELVKLKTNCEESFNEIGFLEDELEKTQIRHHNLHAKERSKSSINNRVHNAGAPWNEHEDRQLRIEFHNALEEIAKIHGRSYGAIESRIRKYWND